tara:strand:- start:873 stop:1223 length:351 start_codon:yes stop_codon:yes gene_type:complete
MLLIGSLAMGATTLREFAVALLVGIFVGSYSSLFLASAIVAGLKEREERWRLVFQKVRSRGVVDGPTRVIGRQEAAVSDTRAAPRSSPTGGPAKRRPTIAAPGAGGAPPRPRKKKR